MKLHIEALDYLIGYANGMFHILGEELEDADPKDQDFIAGKMEGINDLASEIEQVKRNRKDG